ncbi:UbiA family prenyltransferase [Planctomicrobium sp. SH527]|uniref:UbiA family prenyltransferase n=1 Tax=Planctomicrobium sp. SH527 TaxID=3448123 RepID=UPI003F5BEA17
MAASIIPYLRLCRIPTIFTALADIAASYLLVRATWEPPQEFVLVLLASAGLYLSGMVFNDIFDRKIDQQERPGRPIPSGAISVRSAVLFGTILMIFGLIAAAMISQFSLIIACFTAVAIFLYDGVLKKTFLAPISMGTCRFFNILLGASCAAESFADLFRWPQLWYAISMCVYITGVTLFARREARQNTASALFPALMVVNAGLILLGLWFSNQLPSWGIPVPSGLIQPPESIFVLLAVIAATINRRAVAAMFNPSPAVVQAAVGVMLLSLISINAMVIYYYRGDEGINFAIATLALVVPAILIRRWTPMT